MLKRCGGPLHRFGDVLRDCSGHGPPGSVPHDDASGPTRGLAQCRHPTQTDPLHHLKHLRPDKLLSHLPQEIAVWNRRPPSSAGGANKSESRTMTFVVTRARLADEPYLQTPQFHDKTHQRAKKIDIFGGSEKKSEIWAVQRRCGPDTTHTTHNTQHTTHST